MVKATHKISAPAGGIFQKIIRDQVARIVEDTAEFIVQDAKNNCPRDTGALAASIYKVTYTTNDGQAAYDAAYALKPHAVFLPLEANVYTRYEAKVSICLNYWFFQEYGTVFFAAQPFYTPAWERGMEYFMEHLSLVLDEYL